MKYLVRAVKYFFYFAIITTAIVLALVLIGAVEGDINQIFDGGYNALWKIAVFFALVAAVYPELGFISREIPSEKPLADIRADVVNYFRERRYEVESETPETMTFRVKGLAGRLSKMYEDRITLTSVAGGYRMEGLRKDVLRFSTGIEHLCGLFQG